MSGADSPDILAAYDAVRSDKDDTNWLIISYAAATGDALKLTATGTGGFEEYVYSPCPSLYGGRRYMSQQLKKLIPALQSV
jgi:hypothetical protein